MKEQLAKIRSEALAAFEQAQSAAELDSLRVQYLGKKGELTAVLKMMGKLSAEERPAMGQLANEVRSALEAAIEAAAGKLEAQALEQGDFAAFLALVDQSGLSSALNLQNTWSAAAPQQQAIPVALAVGRELLGGSGAIRVHGGGFAGTIQAFVPNEKLETFQQGMEELLGPGMCHILHIRPQGGCVVLK